MWYGGGKGGGTQLLSLEFIEIDLFLLRLRCGRGRPVSGQLRVSYQITHPQYKISPFELSFSVCCSSRVKPIFIKRSSLVLTHDQLLNTVRAV